jgi:2-keto-4-pentenoate hydratase/2-oxohepta-3-ene-1,7-dioic acid hydratase in catechol pathway
MKLASYDHNGRASWGVVTDDVRIIDVRPRLPRFHTLLDVLRADALEEVRETIIDVRPDFKVGEVELLPPVLAPEKILCIGVNYANRNEEYKDQSELPKYPSMFFRTPGSFVGNGQNLIRPPESEQLDYEGEIVLVIGKECHRIAASQAAEHIAGYTLCNEGTIRDWLRHAKFNVTQGKNFDRSGSLGPWMVTADEIEYGRPMHLTTRVNGEIRQDDTTANLIFDFGALLSYITTFTTLKPGDMIVSGTPTGAGARFDPPKWLKPGDLVEVTVAEIGTLSNGVEDGL